MGLGFGGGLLSLFLGLLLHLATKTPEFDVEFAAWNPPSPTELVGPAAPNSLLQNSKHILEGLVDGPETVAVDKTTGLLYTGNANGAILSYDPKTDKLKEVAMIGGRPLGMAFDPTYTTLYVAEPAKGLFAVDKNTGKATLLASKAGNVTITYADDVDVTKDGIVYFSDASVVAAPYQRDSDTFGTLPASLWDILSAVPTGRLIKYDTHTGATEVLISGIQFANGVALSHDESFVLLSETGRYTIHRLWLKGPNAGKKDVFAALPGFPDGVSAGSNGTFWVAIYSPRMKLTDAVHPYPLIKKMSMNLPDKLRVKPVAYSMILQLDSNGNILRSLHDPTGSLGSLTAVTEHNGKLYLGNLHHHFISV